MIKLILTQAEFNHILTLLHDNEMEGSYYGNREHWWKQHLRILKKMYEAEN